jgi:hypothetical protein
MLSHKNKQRDMETEQNLESIRFETPVFLIRLVARSISVNSKEIRSPTSNTEEAPERSASVLDPITSIMFDLLNASRPCSMSQILRTTRSKPSSPALGETL